VMIAASSGLRAFSSSRKANSTWARLASEVSRQAGKAAAAAATTVFTSASEASASCAVTSPVAGLVTSEKRPLVPSRVAPSVQCWSVVAMVIVLTWWEIREW
jgi:hypothetical protein